MMIETKRLQLRSVGNGDLEVFAELFANPQVMEFSDEGPKDKDWTRAWIAKQAGRFDLSGLGHQAVVERDSGNVIGYCGLVQETIDGTTEIAIGWRLLPDMWGKGYATEAAKAMLDYARSKGLKRVVATIDPSNKASLRVAEKLDMHYEKDILEPGYSHPDQLFASGD